jgi:hypothetical protein
MTKPRISQIEGLEQELKGIKMEIVHQTKHFGGLFEKIEKRLNDMEKRIKKLEGGQ